MATKHDSGLAPHVRGVNPKYGEKDEDGYVGVSGEYANAANETDEPHNVKEDDLEVLVDKGVNNQFELAKAPKVEKDKDDDKTQGQPPASPASKPGQNS